MAQVSPQQRTSYSQSTQASPNQTQVQKAQKTPIVSQSTQTPVTLPPKKSIFSKWWFWVIIFAALLIIGFGAWYILK